MNQATARMSPCFGRGACGRECVCVMDNVPVLDGEGYVMCLSKMRIRGGIFFFLKEKENTSSNSHLCLGR